MVEFCFYMNQQLKYYLFVFVLVVDDKSDGGEEQTDPAAGLELFFFNRFI